MKLTKFNIAIIFGILIVAIIALHDISGKVMWEDSGIGSAADYTNGLQGLPFWIFFRNWALSLILVVPLAYYFFHRRDKSETIAIFLTSSGLWFAGLADVLYFWFQGIPVPEVLNHLNNHPVIGRISTFLGFEVVTNVSLYLSVIIVGIILYFTVKYLKEKW